MKFALIVLATLVACSAAVVILPEDFAKTNQAGQCASGLPHDGLFESGMLGATSDPTSWRVGAQRSGKAVLSSDIKFESGFTSIPQFFDVPLQLGSSAATPSMFSVRIPTDGVLFQYLPNLAYAHYRIKACARVHGESPCRVEVRNAENELADVVEFLPQQDLSSLCSGGGGGGNSSSSGSSGVKCELECPANSLYKRITIRYTGTYPTTLMLALPGQDDTGMLFDVSPGQEFNVTADLFAAGGMTGNMTGNMTSNNTGGAGSGGSSDVLPEYFEIIESPNTKQELRDVFISNCSDPTALPGLRFGDRRNYVLAAAWDENGVPLCAVSDVADKVEQCSCESDAVDEQCWISDKGFVAEARSEYYIGLVSRDCSCSFDNVCLEIVNNDEGYLGLEWIRISNANNSTAV